MKSLYLTFSTAILVGFAQSLTIGHTLADCKNIARMFKNTCTEAPDSAASFTGSFAGSTVTCTQQNCPDSVSGPNCAWQRKLCVSCFQSGADVYIRYQSNNLPDHCLMGPSISSQTVDFTVKFNPTVTETKSFASQSVFDNAVCQPHKSQLVPTEAAFTNTGMVLDGIAGVTINGLPIFSSSSNELVDPYFPKWWSGAKKVQAEVVDACIAHPAGNGQYHYHMLSPCILNSNGIETTKVCSMITDCTSDLKSYVMKAYDNYKYEVVLGLAKDGHLILGPYNHNGQLFDCNSYDQCAGATSEDGSYVYIYSDKYPYTLNCFGPAGPAVYEASCSSNTCNPTSSGIFMTALSTVVLSVLATVMSVMA